MFIGRRSHGMAKRSWEQFLKEHPSAHLIVGSMPAEAPIAGKAADFSTAKSYLDVLARLAKASKLAGDYALTIRRDVEGCSILLAVANEEDAAKVAATVEARPADTRSGFSSRRLFAFHDEAADAIEAFTMPRLARRRRGPDAGRLEGHETYKS